MVLNYNDSPAVVVLTVDKYNQLMTQQTPLISGIEDPIAAPLVESRQAVQEIAEKPKNILVTGGAGYIGSHAVRQLLQAGHKVVIVDNLSTGKRSNIPEGTIFLEGDIADTNFLRDVFAAHSFDAVMHFAASIEVEESVKYPQKYFENNVVNTQKLLAVMAEANVKNIVFSSTAAVYGEQVVVPIAENARLQPNNPYGYSKLLCERILKYYSNYLGFHTVVFRYFNACGCDFDGGITPTHESHLIPIVMQTAMGKRPYITVYGTDYKTHDGSAVRDYVHVLDIARAHVLALDYFETAELYQLYNIGSSHGSSVLEIINKASEVLNRIIPMEIGPRRAGDAEVTIADNRKIKEALGFELRYSDLETIIKTTWEMVQRDSRVTS